MKMVTKKEIKKDYRAKYAGKFMTLKIPADLHRALMIDKIDRDDINLDQLAIEYMRLGYNTHHANK
ncbi:MAG: hypothetical protein B6D44_11020 [Ignavibacteriales bacterium UTCHB2]|jgi:predicted HicB family RNase H-like nuclease|nr:MAG: hypothetical protein B6D44_11020 [Ignavibacteriales bacterium UTCHB2]